MPSNKYILWGDLETTGNKDDDGIIEIGLVLTDHNLEVLAYRNWLCTEDYRYRMISQFDPFVLKMHATNGLFEDLNKVYNNYQIVEDDILNWLDEHTNGEKQHIPFGGSGVSHFDRKYMARIFPRLNKRLTYWNLDIGVFRRLLTLFGINADYLNMYVEAKPHRALEDTLLVVAEARAYMAVERRMSGLTPAIVWEHPVPLIEPDADTILRQEEGPIE